MDGTCNWIINTNESTISLQERPSTFSLTLGWNYYIYLDIRDWKNVQFNRDINTIISYTHMERRGKYNETID